MVVTSTRPSKFTANTSRRVDVEMLTAFWSLSWRKRAVFFSCQLG